MQAIRHIGDAVALYRARTNCAFQFSEVVVGVIVERATTKEL